MSRTFLALLQFDGTHFAGWQRQTAERTVQGEVEQVLERLCGAPIAAHAAGRTDAGVHALGLGVSLSVPERWDAPALQRALNALLPSECWVAAVHPMKPGFHARRSARARRYRYQVGTDAAARSPFRRPWEWALGRPLDHTALTDAAEVLPGEHDFTAFSVRGQLKPHHRCRIGLACWTRRPGGRGFRFEIEADRFLHHMVRMLVGTMVDIGLARRPVSDMSLLLSRSDNHETSPPAPPEGLFFVAADYPPDCFLEPVATPTEEWREAVGHG